MSVLGGVAGLGRLGAHGGGGHGGSRLAVQPEAPVELVANGERVVEIKRDEGGRDVAGESLDDDADLLHIGLDVIGPAQNRSWVRRGASVRSLERSPCAGGGVGSRRAGGPISFRHKSGLFALSMVF